MSDGGRGEERKPTRNHLISRRKVREFLDSHPSARKDEEAFWRWCRLVEGSYWTCFADVRAMFADADQVGEHTVFNVGGNKYRLVARIQYKPSRPAWVYLWFVGTHKEYDRLDL